VCAWSGGGGGLLHTPLADSERDHLCKDDSAGSSMTYTTLENKYAKVYPLWQLVEACFSAFLFFTFSFESNFNLPLYPPDNQVAQWSRGMIPALGAGGLGFKSRSSPYFCCFKSLLWIFNKIKLSFTVLKRKQI
jgi:hypothetical protein